MAKKISDEQIASLKKGVQLLRKIDGEMYFLYGPDDGSGLPSLTISKKKISGGEVAQLRKQGKGKPVQGVVSMEGKQITFFPEATPKKMKQALKKYFGAASPLLKKALILASLWMVMLIE